MATKIISPKTSYKKQWLNDAINKLGHYPVNPTITNFMKQNGLKVSGTRLHMLQTIRNKITYGKGLDFSTLVSYVDELRMWGKQYVVLYKLKNLNKTQNMKFLAELAQPIKRKSVLKNGKANEIFIKKTFCWASPIPFLSEVKYKYNLKDESWILTYKWVRTRNFNMLVNNVMRLRQERSVNFFIINLKDGSAQLRIQTLPNMPFQDINVELTLYENEIKNIIRFDYYTKVSLEYVMKLLLLKKILSIPKWKLHTPPTLGRRRGGIIEVAGVRPNFFQRIFTIRRRGVRPREITARWDDCIQEVTRRNLYFYLNNDNSTILFNAITDKDVVNYVLFKIREASDKFIDKTPKPTNGRKEDGGFRGRVLKNPKNRRGSRRVATEAMILLPAVALGLLHYGIKWLLEDQFFEAIFHVPFITVEVLIYLFSIVKFYGVKQIIQWFASIPHKLRRTYIKTLLGQSIDIIINNQNYLWFKAHQA